MSARTKKKKKPAHSGGSKLRGKAKARKRAGSQHSSSGSLAWPMPVAGAGGDGVDGVEEAESDGSGSGSGVKINVENNVENKDSGGAVTAGSAKGEGSVSGEKFSRKRQARQAELAARQTRDGLRWIGVGLLVLSGIVANFYFDESSLLYRLLGMVGIGILSAPLALGTTSGLAFSQLLREARIELRKVVWPTRSEVAQTTLLVLAFVLFVALILWGLDAALGWIVSRSVGG